jgi:hypothetical protein
MKPVIRWLVAGLVTIAAFASVAWICGAVVLATFMKDPGARWGVAGALGVAVAALAALWGHSFASAEVTLQADSGSDSCEDVHGPDLQNPGNTISGGTFHGPVIQGRNVSIARPATCGLSQLRDRGGPESPG